MSLHKELEGNRRELGVFELTNSKGRTWATLKIASRAHSSTQIPSFVEGDSIVGSLTLNLENGDPIHTISISVTGRIVAGLVISGLNPFNREFLNQSKTLWSRSMGDPRGSVLSSAAGKFDQKLHGEYTWPFSIPIPKEVTLLPLSGDTPKTFRLPHSFMERLTRSSIRYDLFVYISRSILYTNSEIHTPLVYVPITRPSPPSLLRQLAYRERTPLSGPDVDPEGWKTSSVTIRGKIFNDHLVEVQCMFSLAKPLCYTKNSVIPCMLLLECDDSQALDLLSLPTSINVHLRRRIVYDARFGQFGQAHKKDREWKDASEDIASGVWRRRSSNQGLHQRLVEGEIRLARDLQPSSAMATLFVNYDVVLLPFEVTGFSPAEMKPLVSEAVEIATMFADGPRPTAFSPPAYDTASRPSQQGFRLSPNGGFSFW